MNFYDEILLVKKNKKLNNKQLGEVINKSSDAIRFALKRKSLTELEINKLKETFFDKNIGSKFQDELSKDDLADLRMQVNMTQAKFSELVGVDIRTVQNWESGDITLKGAKARKVKRLVDNYIEGSYNNAIHQAQKLNESKEEYNSAPALSNNGQGVPYYDVDFSGGVKSVLNDQTIQPSYYINYPPYNESDIWINVVGKSMSPFISHGDIAALKRLYEWEQWFPPGEVYAIYTSEHRTIKIVTAGKDENHFLLKSYNNSPEFVDTQIPKSIIKGMFRVMGSIKKFF